VESGDKYFAEKMGFSILSWTLENKSGQLKSGKHLLVSIVRSLPEK
jgi:hypothetical protein